MITVSVLYPHSDTLSFDMDYYLSKHMKLVSERVGSALKGYTIDKGVAGGTPGSKPMYHVMLAMRFESIDAFAKSFGPHAAEILADIPKYTNARPVVQISEPIAPG